MKITSTVLILLTVVQMKIHDLWNKRMEQRTYDIIKTLLSKDFVNEIKVDKYKHNLRYEVCITGWDNRDGHPGNPVVILELLSAIPEGRLYSTAYD